MKQRDLNCLIVCAVRYALGRRTYIVGWVGDIVKEYIDEINLQTKKTLIRDIEEAEDYGDCCDYKVWADVLKSLKESVEKEKER